MEKINILDALDAAEKAYSACLFERPPNPTNITRCANALDHLLHRRHVRALIEVAKAAQGLFDLANPQLNTAPCYKPLLDALSKLRGEE